VVALLLLLDRHFNLNFTNLYRLKENSWRSCKDFFIFKSWWPVFIVLGLLNKCIVEAEHNFCGELALGVFSVFLLLWLLLQLLNLKLIAAWSKAFSLWINDFAMALRSSNNLDSNLKYTQWAKTIEWTYLLFVRWVIVLNLLGVADMLSFITRFSPAMFKSRIFNVVEQFMVVNGNFRVKSNLE